LTVDRVTKKFGDFVALDAVSLAVRDGEFLAVLGPSGCGKTTLLRLIAGFDGIDGGSIAIGEETVSSPQRRIPPEERRVGIVFQNYALWPHMTVSGNIGYGLKVAGVREPELTRRIDATLDLVGLAGFGARRPADLSGGQRQRVALARCLATEPSLVLLDEPLANLDVHLRASMEEEFSRFHQQAGRTMIYITHDQAEAMALADRIAVLDKGRLLQLATPSELYREPASAAVGRFIGQGFVLPLENIAPDGAGHAQATLYGTPVRVRCAPSRTAAATGQLCLRAGDLRLAGPGEAGLGVVMERLVYQGGRFRATARVAADPAASLRIDLDAPATVCAGESATLVVRDGWILPEAGPESGSR
jgi:iron(III) transport system ATP-binding protein